MKKRCAGLLTAVVLMLCFGTRVLGQTEYTEGSLKYIVTKGSITITGYFGQDETVTVPKMIAGFPVNTIADGAFSDSKIRSIMLPETIMTVEEGAIPSETATVIYDDADAPKAAADPASKSEVKKDTQEPPKGSVAEKSDPKRLRNRDEKHVSENGYSAMKKGEKTIVGDLELTVMAAGKTMRDQNGECYTIDEAGNIVDWDHQIIAKTAQFSEEDTAWPMDSSQAPNLCSAFKEIMIAIFLAGLGVLLVFELVTVKRKGIKR